MREMKSSESLIQIDIPQIGHFDVNESVRMREFSEVAQGLQRIAGVFQHVETGNEIKGTLKAALLPRGESNPVAMESSRILAISGSRFDTVTVEALICHAFDKFAAPTAYIQYTGAGFE